MKLYDKYVNYSVFDGEITLTSPAKRHLLASVFEESSTNKAIELIIDGVRYNALLMNVSSSKSIQIEYGRDVKAALAQMFAFSFDYWITIRDEAEKLGLSTRNLPTQTIEKISISETDEPLVYIVKSESHYDSANPYDKNNLESEDSIYFEEGKKGYVKHAKYERNQGLIKLAKKRFTVKYGSLFCEVCGFSFDKHYGKRGQDFIEAHHDVPVSQLGLNATSNINDIRMVCSNCHRMLHRKDWLTVDELKEQLETSGSIQ